MSAMKYTSVEKVRAGHAAASGRQMSNRSSVDDL